MMINLSEKANGKDIKPCHSCENERPQEGILLQLLQNIIDADSELADAFKNMEHGAVCLAVSKLFGSIHNARVFMKDKECKNHEQ